MASVVLSTGTVKSNAALTYPSSRNFLHIIPCKVGRVTHEWVEIGGCKGKARTQRLGSFFENRPRAQPDEANESGLDSKQTETVDDWGALDGFNRHSKPQGMMYSCSQCCRE